jgi:hypothetical protein
VNYAFCESISAGPQSKWHIRVLSREGVKLGGGLDTASLCGHVKSPYGWDLDVELFEHHLANSACKDCVALYRKFLANTPKQEK